MKSLSSLEKKTYSSQELYDLLECSSEREIFETMVPALEKKEIEGFFIIKLPFEMFGTNISFHYKSLKDIPSKLALMDGTIVPVHFEYVKVRFKIL